MATTRSSELADRLKLKGTRKHPKRKTHRRWWIAAAVVHLRFAAIDRELLDRKGHAKNLEEAAYCRRVAHRYGRTERMTQG